LRGQTQRKVFEALASVFDLETPGRYQVELWQLGSATGLSDDQVRRALAALGEAGHLQYEPPPRGRGVEKLVAPPPPFAKVPVDWQRHEMRRGIEEEKLSGIERYISGPTCRRKAILQYFGEQNGAACGICDRCRKPPQPSAGRSSGDVLASWPDVAGPVLVCLRHLRFPVGVGRIAQVVTGSRDSELLSWKLDKNPAYGSVRAKQETVKRVIENLRTEGYLKREGEDPRRPVLALTARGKAAAEAVEKGGSATPAPPKSPKPASLTKATILAKMAKAFESPGSSSAPASSAKPERSLELVPERPMATTKKPSPTAITDAGRFLDELVRAVLAAKADEAESLVEKLRVFHPREVVPRLEASAVGGDAQVRGRAAWVVGELCEAQGLAFLIRSAIDKEANVRRLAASALGKVASRRRGAEAEEQQHWAMARLALQVLLNDAAPQVRQYAQKSLAAFPAEATPGHKA
jgi:DNA-binding MarR family transcriptional regulator